MFNPYLERAELDQDGGAPARHHGRRRRVLWRRRLVRRLGVRASRSARQYRRQEVDPSRLDWSRIDIRSLNIYQPPGPTTCSAPSNSCSPTSMTSTCTTRRRRICSPRPFAPRAMAACGCKTPINLPSFCCKQDQGWSAANVASAIKARDAEHSSAEAEDPRLHHLFHPVGERRRLDLDLQRPLRP